MVGQLVGEEGVAQGLVLRFEEGEEWSIGRDPEAAELIIVDSMVSRRHVLCRKVGDGYTIENLSETNPMLINEEPLTAPHLLEEGDHILIGDTTFRFTTSDELDLTPRPLSESPAEEEPYETIYRTGGEPLPETGTVDLTQTGRWLLKVVSGPNTGAELSMMPDHAYTLGTDAGSCDVVFHDLSVSRQHARITLSGEDTVSVEDLHSRNGLVVDGQLIEEPTLLRGNSVVALGTTSFVLIDREQAQETIFSVPPPEEQTPPAPKEEGETPEGGDVAVAREKPILSGGAFILILVALAIVVVVVAGSLSLFKTGEVEVQRRDYKKEIQGAIGEFPDLKFTYNANSGKLFLLGHVLTPVEKSELFYNLQNLTFIKEIDDNIIVDQYVWEEYNAILSKNPNWRGVSIYSPGPGQFVLSGYLMTRQQGTSLQDYMRINFPYLDKLDNQVVIEQILMENIASKLLGAGFGSVKVELSNGELTLTGYIGRENAKEFDKTIAELKKLHGVRAVRNYVVIMAEDQSVIDLTGRYNVQGFSRHDDATVNVLIDGQILTKGDLFQGMTIVSITPTRITLEKNGVKYKIDYKQ